MPNYRVRMAGSKSGEILLYDDIGGGGFFGGGISAKQFADDLKNLGKIDTLNLRVNSPGGDVFEGLAIYNTIARHPAHVVVDVDGMALSIASIIIMAGDQINMADNAMLMIHDPFTVAAGTADDFREKADLMEQVKGNLVKVYADRTKNPENEISDWMREETWMTAKEAKANGFIDSVTENLQLAASFDLSRFRNAPKALAGRRSQPVVADLYRAKIAAMSAKIKR